MSADLRRRINDLCRDFMLGRLDVVLGAVDDDIDFSIYAPPDIVASQGRKHGKAALAAIWLKLQSEFEYLKYRPHVLNGVADMVAVVIAADLRHRSSGDVVSLFIADFIRFRRGRIVEMREFANRAEGVEQLFARKNASMR